MLFYVVCLLWCKNFRELCNPYFGFTLLDWTLELFLAFGIEDVAHNKGTYHHNDISAIFLCVSRWLPVWRHVEPHHNTPQWGCAMVITRTWCNIGRSHCSIEQSEQQHAQDTDLQKKSRNITHPYLLCVNTVISCIYHRTHFIMNVPIVTHITKPVSQ